MKRIVLAVLLLAMVAGCESPTASAPPVSSERPTVNLPLAMRQSNWRGPEGQGSCTWATMVSLLRWQGRYHTADWVRQNCGDGEWPDDMAQKLDEAAVRYAYVDQRRREVPGVGVSHAAGLRHHGDGRRAHGRPGASRRQVGRDPRQQRRREDTSGFRERR